MLSTYYIVACCAAVSAVVCAAPAVTIGTEPLAKKSEVIGPALKVSNEPDIDQFLF